VDDLEFVSVVKIGFRPTVTRDDIAIKLHGYAVRLHAEGFDQSRERGWSGIEVALFVIDVELHVGFGIVLLSLRARRFVVANPTAYAVGCILPPLRGAGDES
jgi:hypothetical protein